MYKLRQRLSLVFFLILGFATLTAQERSGTLTGLVTDAEHYVLPGARIELQPRGQAAVSDQEGRFTMANLRPGDYTVTVSYVGLLPLTKPISVQAGQVVRL